MPDRNAEHGPILLKTFGKFHLSSHNSTVDSDIEKKVFFNYEISNNCGLLNLKAVFDFMKALEIFLKKTHRMSDVEKIIWQCNLDQRSLTNAALLVGSYMVVKLGFHSDEVWSCFEPIRSNITSYRDVSPGMQNFYISLKDCWSALWRANQLGWIKSDLGAFDAREYAHYGNPLNADLHEVVPGKIIAMRGPVALPAGQHWRDVRTGDGCFSHRELSPEHYISVLRHFDVQAVVRLNTPEYDPAVFTREGLAFVDLYCQDRACPAPDAVAKFLLIAERLPGAIAVHCRAGLGRAGTLIALYMMRTHGFAAREAIAWLRIVRPGSVVGPQPHYLVAREAAMRRAAPRPHRGPPPAAAAGDAARQVADAIRAVDARLRDFLAAPRTARCLDDIPVAQSESARGAGGDGDREPAAAALWRGRAGVGLRAVAPGSARAGATARGGRSAAAGAAHYAARAPLSAGTAARAVRSQGRLAMSGGTAGWPSPPAGPLSPAAGFKFRLSRIPSRPAGDPRGGLEPVESAGLGPAFRRSGSLD